MPARTLTEERLGPRRLGPARAWTIWLALVLLTAFLPDVCHAQKRTMPRSERHEYRRQVEKCEEAWRTAMLKGNSTELANLLADDYTAITSSGAIETRQEAVDGVRTGKFKLTHMDISDQKVRIYHSTAVVTSKADVAGSRNGQDLTGRYRYMRVYVRNSAGQWKIVSFEASRIDETGDRK